MNQDRVEGTLRTGMGKAQQGASDITGSSRQQGEGTRQELMGRAQEWYGSARQSVQNATDQVSRNVAEHPVRSLLIAGAVGCAAALLTGRRRRNRQMYSERQHY
ncbi:CsbD family protein [Pedomonas mirosovicensis]|uniref:CsbD family protein n=1 Tax=Pedomonas mirosovicensis TaxID=2908641 RepID=UPI00216A40BE|nr:CsbD family protein [Pedomonas mirosovicensis]MCH8686437.1 CsbD family protein [Pedomonas mirosovicensis]